MATGTSKMKRSVENAGLQDRYDAFQKKMRLTPIHAMDDSTTKRVPHLPKEIWQIIGEHAENDTLQSLHQVSRDMEYGTKLSYAREFLTHIFIILNSPESLEKAVDVAQKFGEFIERVTVFMDEMHTVETQEVLDPFHFRQYFLKPGWEVGYDAKEKAYFYCKLQNWLQTVPAETLQEIVKLNMTNAQIRLRRERADGKLLNQFFGKLVNRKNMRLEGIVFGTAEIRDKPKMFRDWLAARE